MFSQNRTDTPEARQWLAEQLGAEEIDRAMHELEGYEELVDRLFARHLARLTPEQRLAGLTPDEVLLALPDAILRALSEEFLAGLSEATRAAVRARTAR